MDIGSNGRFTLGLLTVFGQNDAKEVTTLNLPKRVGHGLRSPISNIKACTPSKSEGSNQVGSAQTMREADG